MKKISLLVALCLLMVGCANKQTAVSDTQGNVALQYATLLTLDDNGDYVVATIQDPWNAGAILHTYILVDKAIELPAALPEGTIVRTPVENVLVDSSVHCGLFEQIGALDQIGGVFDLMYINMPSIQDKVAAGTLTDCGNSMDPDIEKIIDLHPEAIFLSPFENSGGYGRIEKLNIPLVECADYMEVSPLARAEWMKFYGLLLGQAPAADDLFDSVAEQYNTIKAMTDTLAVRPTVVSDLRSSGVWYVPGGKSTTAELFADAGFAYVYADNDSSGSLALALEEVFDKGQDADFWLIRYWQMTDKTYNELESEYAQYANFKAFAQRNVWGCNTSYQTYYEDATFRPHLILADLVSIAHPELGITPEKHYFAPIADE